MVTCEWTDPELHTCLGSFAHWRKAFGLCTSPWPWMLRNDGGAAVLKKK